MTGTRPRLENAACRGREDLKDNPRALDYELMRKICGTCWDRPECLAWALEREERGYWGGHTPAARRQLRAKYGIELQAITSGMWVMARSDNQGNDDGFDDAGAVAAAY